MIAEAGNPSLNGRNGNGRFAKGNAGGPGNPHTKRVGELRAALINSIKEQDIQEVAAALLAKAKEGDVPAIKELLDRILGKPAQAVEIVDTVGPVFDPTMSRDELIDELRKRAQNLAQKSTPAG